MANGHSRLFAAKMKKEGFTFLVALLFCISLAGCRAEAPGKGMEEETADAGQTVTGSNSNHEEEQVFWESFLASIQAEDIGYPSWSINRANPIDEELAQYLQNAASCQTDLSADRFGDIIWTLYMYVDAPPEDELDPKHQLSWRQGFKKSCGQYGAGAHYLTERSTLTTANCTGWRVRSTIPTRTLTKTPFQPIRPPLTNILRKSKAASMILPLQQNFSL